MPRLRTLRPSVAVERFTLRNGLRVVLSPDRSSPTVFVACYYDVGMRSEPRGRTGFAHLFEHLMFQGSVNLPKGRHDELTTGNGGVNNGSTANDFTNYYEMMPSNALELSLFLEADRMRGLLLTPENLRNQIDVVKEEIKVNVRNRAYGGFPWLYLPRTLFTTWPNAHDGYGSFEDLEAATLDDARDFFDRYYAPGNCVLSVAGDLDVEQTARWVEHHFGDIEARPVPAVLDASEPLPDRERLGAHTDTHAPDPALALGYRIPDPIHELDDYLAAVLLSEVLTAGDASRLHHRLVRRDLIATHVVGEVGLAAGTFEVRGPSMLQIVVYHIREARRQAITRAIDEEAARAAEDLREEELERFRNAYISGYLGNVDSLAERGMLLAVLEQQRSAPELINEIPDRLSAVTATDVQRTAGEWLRPERRGVLEWRPGGRR